MTLFLPVSVVDKTSASILTHCFSSHPATFGFRASSTPDSITLNPTHKKTDQSVAVCIIFRLALVQLLMPLLIQSSLFLYRNCTCGHKLHPSKDLMKVLFQFQKCMNYSPKFYDTVDNAVCKWLGNAGHILVYVFNSVCRQHYEIWALHFPFLYSFKDTVPASDAYLYGCIIWPLAQA